MKLSTSRKLTIARVLFHVINFFFCILGKKSHAIKCKRNGLIWELDLSQGIDLSIFIFGKFEPSTSTALKRLCKPGMTVLDIGANIGAHTLPMARLVGDRGLVVAIEPTDWAYHKLQKNVELNPSLVPVVCMVKAVIGSGEGLAPTRLFASWKLTDNHNQNHPAHGGSLCEVSQAEYIQLDQVVNERLQLKKVDLIKLDVDGFEYPVILGGMSTLEKHRPVIIMELCPYVHLEYNRKVEDTIDLLRELGYVCLSERDGKLLPSDKGELLSIIPAGGGINVVCCHKLNLHQTQTFLG